MRRLLRTFAILTVLVVPSQADEAAEASPELSRAVSKANEWMTSDRSAESPELAAKSTAISLDRATRRDAAAMASRLPNARLVAVAVYNGRPTTLAGDLSRQLRAIDDIPEDKRRPLLVDASKVARANEVAAAWVNDLLDCNDRDAVAACVYWFADDKTHSLLAGAEPEHRLYLVLTRFTRGTDSPHAIARIAWGPVTESPGRSSDER